MSRDEQNILVVSYGEIKQFLEQSWAEVEAASVNVSETGPLPRGGPTRTDLAHSNSAAINLPGAAMMASEEGMADHSGVGLRSMGMHGHGD